MGINGVDMTSRQNEDISLHGSTNRNYYLPEAEYKDKFDSSFLSLTEHVDNVRLCDKKGTLIRPDEPIVIDQTPNPIELNWSDKTIALISPDHKLQLEVKPNERKKRRYSQLNPLGPKASATLEINEMEQDAKMPKNDKQVERIPGS